jgi:hypothetical protein
MLTNVTRNDGTVLAINFERVLLVAPNHDGGSIIYFSKEHYILVRDPIERIVQATG